MALDIVLINPGDRKQVFQDLGRDYSGVEPPFWLAAIAAYLRNNGFAVAVIDAAAENYTPEETGRKTAELKPNLAAVIVYGTQPSASTQNMTAAGKICRSLKENTAAKVALAGLHPSALPERTLKEEQVDFVVDGEGPLTFKALLESLRKPQPDYSAVPGFWYFDAGAVRSNPRPPLAKNPDEILPLAAWDLLPMDRYRAHNWHCFDDLELRSPYAAVYTSLGCPYNCLFCCINAPFGKPGIRYRSPELVVEEITLLSRRYRVRNIKFIDELFVLDERHYLTIVDLLLRQGLDLNIWAYARVDTVKPENLRKMKQAGINWLALGIESANPAVRDGAIKRMKNRDIGAVVRAIQDSGIRVIGNFIFGLPEDDLATMQETLDLALELNCEFVNFYCAMAYPGSRLYELAVRENWKLPKEWHDFSQYAYGIQPLPTRHLSAGQVLQFRDDAFHRYYENPAYLEMVEKKFGPKVKAHISEMTRTRLKRRLLE